MNKTKFHKDYDKGEYLHSTEDMAHAKVDGYLVEDEIHLVYAHAVSIRKIEEVQNNLDAYMWTPFIEFITEEL